MAMVEGGVEALAQAGKEVEAHHQRLLKFLHLINTRLRSPLQQLHFLFLRQLLLLLAQ